MSSETLMLIVYLDRGGNKIEAADGYILATPTNFGTTTAVFQGFMERLIVYAYWSWEKNAPQFRQAHLPKKRAVLIFFSAVAGLMRRFFFDTRKQLKVAVQMIGANAYGTLFTGMITKSSNPVLPESARHKMRKLALALTQP